jgi:uncharacterized damage-inducible protein DinB
MNPADIRHLFDYTEWANELVLDAAAQLSEEQLRQDFSISHGSIFGTLLHMAGAEWIWLERWREVVDRRARFTAELDQSQLPANLPFKLISGVAGSLPLAGQMQHVVNHATLHRGQVVGMIRQLGLTPPSTDLLFYLRR